MGKETKWLTDLHQEISYHLEQIGKLFKNPKITLVVRNLDLANGDVLLSDDDHEKAIAAIRRLDSDPAYAIEKGDVVKDSMSKCEMCAAELIEERVPFANIPPCDCCGGEGQGYLWAMNLQESLCRYCYETRIQVNSRLPEVST